jgi:hypothetical protein
MKLSNQLLALLVGLVFCGLGEGESARGDTRTVVLPCATNMTGYANKGRINCTVKLMSDPNVSPTAPDASYLLIGQQLGPVTNRIVLSFVASPLLKNTNIASVQLQFNVLDVTNWPTPYQVKFRAFSTTGTDCGAIWADAADGAEYGALNLYARHGVNSVQLNSTAVSALMTAMNAGQDFALGMVADDRPPAFISSCYSATPPSLTVIYDCTAAAPAGLAVTSTCGAVGLSWNAVPGALSYRVLRGNDLIGSLMGTSFTYHPADCAAYAYSVQAVNGCGLGRISEPVWGQPGCPPAPAGAVAASDGSDCQRVRISWSSVAGVTGYGVLRDGHLVASLPGSATAYEDTPGDTSTHTYVVWTTNSCGATPSTADAGFLASAPGAPATFWASQGTFATGVYLYWSPVPSAAGYQVWRSAVNDPAAARPISVSSGGTATTGYDFAVSLFTTNYYWVKATNSCGASGFSAGSFGWASTAPAKPTVTASYGTYADRINVSWNAVAGATAYVLYRNTSNTTTDATQLVSTTGVNYTDTTAASCTPYWYWVAANNLSGSSDVSSPARGFAGTVPGVPAGLTVTDAGPANGLSLAWNPVPGAVGYAVWRSPSSNPANRQLLARFTAVPAYQDASAALCTRYWYWVTATNTCTTSDFSVSADGLVAAAPAAPTNVLASAGLHTRYVQLCWDPVPGATGYVVRTNATEDLATAATLATTANSCYTDNIIVPATTNFYWVRATNGCGQSDFSASTWGYRATPIEVTLQTVPAGLTLVVDGTNLVAPQTFSWEPASCHTLSVPSPQAGAVGTRYVLNAWSDPALSNSICAWSNATYTTSFTTQHYLGTSVALNGGGTVSPGSGWYDEAGSVLLTAVPESGFTLKGWTGTGANAYTGTANPLTLVMNGPVTEVASFTYTNPCYYALVATNTLFSGACGTGAVAVTTAGPCAWLFTNTCSWLSILSAPTNCPGADCPAQSNVVCCCGPGTLVYRVATNDTGYSRFALLEIAGQTLVITQAVECNYVFSPAYTNVSAAARAGSFSVSAASECAWSAVSSNAWIHTTSTGTGPGVVVYTVDANADVNSRVGKIVAGERLFTVVQDGACNYTLTPPGVTVTNREDGTFVGSFQVSAGSACAWTATTTNDWITLSSTANSGVGNGMVLYTLAANPGTNVRAGALLVAGQTFTIQQGPGCGYALSSSATNVSAAACTVAVSVTAGPGCSWAAVPGASWIHSTSRGTGNGTLLVQVDANQSGGARSATFSVKGLSFTINQAAPAEFVNGTYQGLFAVAPAPPVLVVNGIDTSLLYDTNNIQTTNAGFLSASLTSKRMFTGKVYLDGGSYAFHGRFGLDGHTNLMVARRDKASLALDLQLAGLNALTGTVASVDGAWTASLRADRAVFGPRNPCPYVGLYTFLLPGNADFVSYPGGDSFGTLRVAANGRVSLAGKLADGVTLSQGCYLAEDGRLPLFGSLYQGRGLLLGWVQLPVDSTASLDGQLAWLKPQTGKGLYPSGFHQAVVLTGQKYVAPGSRESVFNFTNSVLEVSGGNLAAPLSLPFQFLSRTKALPQSEVPFRLSLSPAAGTFSGSLLMSSSGKATPFQGVLMRPSGGGFGYFSGTNQSGFVRFGPAGP